jgi:hypothetical protein
LKLIIANINVKAQMNKIYIYLKKNKILYKYNKIALNQKRLIILNIT